MTGDAVAWPSGIGSTIATVLAHSRALKAGDRTTVIQADLRDPDAILGHRDTQALIDLAQPLAILFISVLHFISDAEAPHEIVTRFLDAAAPGSYLALSHVTTDPGPRTADRVAAVYASTANPATARTREQILAFFDGLDLVDPCLVPVSHWRPAVAAPEHAVKHWMLGGIGRKPI